MKKTLPSTLVVTSLFPVLLMADSDIPAEIAPMVVTSDAPDYVKDNLAGSVDEISKEEIQIQQVTNVMELFTRVPGVYLARYNQGIVDSEIGIRGFSAEGTTPHAATLIDGIPSNTHSGFSEMNQLFPADISNIDVYKGNSDPRYGLFNIAGNYNIETRSDIGREVTVTAGSYNEKQVQAYAGEQTGDLRHNYFFGYRDADGYRDNEKTEKYSASGRWFYDFNDDTSLGFIARFSGIDADAAGFLDRDVAKTHPTRSAGYAAQDGGEKHTNSFSLHFDHAFSDSLDWSLKSYFNHYERERWVRFKQDTALQNRNDEEDHYGFITTLSWEINPEWKVQWGADVQKQEVLEQRFGTVGFQRERDRSAVNRDRHYDFVSYGSYIQISNSPVDWLSWNAAMRADRLRGEYWDKDLNSISKNERNIYDFGTIVQPKLNVFIYPTDDVTVFFNYGQSFQHPVGKNAYTAGDTSARDVSMNDGWELGSKWEALSTLALSLSYWEQRASDEYIQLVDGSFSNVGKTLRQGVDVGFSWQANMQTTVWGNVSKIESEIQTPGATDGNQLIGVPDYTASVGVNYQLTPKLMWQTTLDSQSGSYVNSANEGRKFGKYNLVNTSLNYDAGWGDINFRVNNLFNEYYEYVYDWGTDGTDTIHSPGNGVNASLSVSYRFK
ncbi:outer membrane receptor protein, mostly Fe transport [Methylophaga aminisulfidivorans MP]|uniref:Outer membrane receptor protein, mostly Fe transport n=1 Tax=Methylophaga aminisulfidivorans MP TaxID=1026882 RepID=F5SX29_9GAMM|nr:TonB-dependent receptor [Methylophaga aminisulfidivorans]EGL54922.1 outer membrane receptor protein, mostly Fe transport [Methylophaga aminisulfidivorans MP]